MTGLLVAYGCDEAKQRRWHTFADSIGVPAERQVVVDNAGGGHCDVTGSNAQFEFSGYLEGLRFVHQEHGSPERLVIFNDTLFEHHWAAGWSRIVAAGPRSRGIWGDGRRDRVDGTGRSLQYFASWHFDLVGPEAVEVFGETLEQVIGRFDEPDDEPAYEAHLERYVLRSTHRRGYSNPAAMRDERARRRKLACIRAEHRLGQSPEFAARMRSYRGARYQLVHAADRLLSARRRVASLRRAI